MGARIEEVCRFAGSTTPALARRLKSRRPLPVVHSFFAACNVAGRSPEKTAAKVVSWQRREVVRTFQS